MTKVINTLLTHGMALLLVSLISCSESPKPTPTVKAPEKIITNTLSTDSHELETKTPSNTYIETGDLAAIKLRGTLRLIAPKYAEQSLPRQGLPSQEYRILAEEFAEKLGLTPKWIYVDSVAQQIPFLATGKGDVIASHLTRTKMREQHVTFSLPISQTEDQIIQPVNTKTIEIFKDLNGKHIAVPEGSSFLESIQSLKKKKPELDLKVTALKNLSDPEVIIDRVVQGDFDATILDSQVVSAMLNYRTDIKHGMTISRTRPIAWATRSSSSVLLNKLNEFLTEKHIKESVTILSTDDFQKIKERKTLRLITQNSPTSYFMWRGELMGFEYELVQLFAKKHQLRLEVVVAPPEVDMIEWLKQGRGDLIASSMTITKKRQEKGIRFTRMYNKVHEQIVSHSSASEINDLSELDGRTLVIKPDHAYWQTALKLKEQDYQFELVAANDDLSSSDILTEISEDRIDTTIIDSHQLSIESKFLDNLSGGPMIGEERKHGWAVRQSNPELLSALNRFIKKNYRGLNFNIIYNKYYKNEKRIGKYQGQRLSEGDALSPFDNIIQPLAQRYQFDWRLVVSQMYQESKFDPQAKSFAGALGLLQVMPRTAKELGYSIPFSAESGIQAGIEYLNWTRDRFEEQLPIDERLWFSLAAYNAGFGHVNDARRLAREKGWNGDKWFNHVEKAMLLLANKEYYQKARFGYVRGSEPVHYVRNIRDRYNAYLSL